jgi:hypothetical protein
MQLNWTKCQGDVWCKLNSVNLNHEHFDNRYGVYIIWHGGTNPAVVYVGQGYIKDRLAAHRQNSEIQSFERFGLYVTWATVSKQKCDGVEVYLANTWSPKVGGTYPHATPIKVNSPWAT